MDLDELLKMLTSYDGEQVGVATDWLEEHGFTNLAAAFRWCFEMQYFFSVESWVDQIQSDGIDDAEEEAGRSEYAWVAGSSSINIKGMQWGSRN